MSSLSSDRSEARREASKRKVERAKQIIDDDFEENEQRGKL